MLDLRSAGCTLAFAVVSLAPNLHAAPGDLDPEFLLGIGAGITGSGYPDSVPPGAVNAVGLQSDGKILVGGSRSRYNDTGELTVLKRLNANGSLDAAFAPGATYGSGPHIAEPLTGDAEINALLVNADDSFYLGGVFENYGGDDSVRALVAKVNADGTLDASFTGPNFGTQNGGRYVQALARQPDGKLLIGGTFSTSGRSNLIRIDGTTGALDTSFTFGLSGVAGVDCISIAGDGRIYVSGATTANRPMAVRLFANGAVDTSWQAPFTIGFGRVNKILALPDSRVLIGGSYDIQGGVAGTDFLNCLTATGVVDPDFQQNLGTGSSGWTGGVLQRLPTGQILAGGIFSSFNGDNVASLVVLNPDGTRVEEFDPAPYTTAHNGYLTHFYAAAMQADGRIVAGGWFTHITEPTLPIRNLARFEGTHGIDPSIVQLDSASYLTSETAGTVDIGIVRLGNQGQVTVNYATSNGTASAGTHYTATAGNVTWLDGESGVRKISIPIADVAGAGPNRTFTFALSGLTGAESGDPATASVLIEDDEAAPVVTRDPAAVTTNQGNAFSISVAYLSPIAATVQWQFDGGAGFADINGATGVSYAVPLADPAQHNGSYRAVITSNNGSDTSAAALVTILTPAGSIVPSFVSTLSGRKIAAAAPDATGRFVVATYGSGIGAFQGVQRLTATGTVDATFPELAVGGIPTALHVLPDGKIVVGGFITNRLIRLTANGALDATFTPSLPASASDYPLTIAPGFGGKYYVGFASGGGLRRYHADGSLDVSFTAPANLGSDLDGSVDAVLELPNGKILVSHMVGRNGQGFTYNLWRLNANGSQDTAFVAPTANNKILAIADLPDGRIAIGGHFSVMNGTPAPGARLALLHSDGSLSGNFVSPTPNAGVTRILYRDGRLLVSGQFQTIGGASVQGIARLNLDGSLDSSFIIGAGANSTVNFTHFTAGGDIFVAGDFTQFNSVACNAAVLLLGRPEIGSISFEPARVEAVEADTTLTLTLRRHGAPTGSVSVDWVTAPADPATAAMGEDFAAAAGTVTWADGDATVRTITINLLDDDAVEQTETFKVVLGNPAGPITTGANATLTLFDSDTPVTFTQHPTGTSLIAGAGLNLTAAATSPSPVSYQWLRNGVPVPGMTSPALNLAVTTQADAGVYVLQAANAAGPFVSNPALVIISPQSGRIVAGQATSGRPNFGSNNPWAVLPLPDGGALVGGTFNTSVQNNINQAYLIRIKADGSTDTGFNRTMHNTVTALFRQPDGKILVGGTFTTQNLAPCNHVLRLNEDLTLDTEFNTNIGTAIGGFGSVADFAIDSLGRIYVAYNNFNPSAVYRFDSTGVLDGAYTVGTNSGVTAIALQSDDKLLVAGNFSQINSTSVSRLARLETGGAIDASFTSLIGGTANYNDILVLKDGRIFVAGSNFANGATIAQVSATGGFASNVGSGNQVYKLVQGPEGKILVARTSVSGSGSLYRLKGTNPLPSPGSSDGDATFNVGTGPNADVRTIAIGPDGSIWAAGEFTTFDGVATGGVVKLQGDPLDPSILTPPSDTAVNVTATAYLGVGAVGTNLTYQWLKNGQPVVEDARVSGATTAILRIEGVTAADDDFYSVEVTGGTPPTTLTSAEVKLDVLAAPVVVEDLPATVFQDVGSTVVLDAGVLAATPATYVWTRNGVVIQNGGRYSGADGTTLTITGGNAADNGAYVLTVTNHLGVVSTATSTVIINQVAHLRDGSTTSLSLAATGSNQVQNFLTLPDGRMLVAATGQLSGASGTSGGASNRLFLVGLDNQVSNVPAGAFNGQVNALFRLPSGKIIVSGAFTQVGGVNRPGVARLNADLSLDSTFAPAAGHAQGANHIAADSLGRVYLGGLFSNYAGQFGYRYLVRLLDNGELDTAFNLDLNDYVYGLARAANGDLLVAGMFTYVGETSVPGLFRLKTDGTLDPTFTAALPAGSRIQAMTVDAQGRIYVAEQFPPYPIRRLNPNGTLDASFTFAETMDGAAITLFAQADGKLLVGGNFTTPTNRLFRLNANGSRDTGFDVGTGFAGGLNVVNVITQDLIGRIWVGGAFNSYNGTTVNRLVVLQGDPVGLRFITEPLGAVVDSGAASISFYALASANNGVSYRWKRNGLLLSNDGHISGATTGTLTISGITTADIASYTAVATSGAVTIDSRPAVLAVLSTPEITADPVDKTVDIGSNVTFTGAATGAATLSYQWLFNDVPLSNGTGVSGATTMTLTLTGVDFADAGDYSLRVTNTFGSDESMVANLTVQKRPGGLAAVAQPTFGGDVYAVLLLNDGSYVVGGAFTDVTINGTQISRSRLARIRADGTLDLTFPTAGGTVRALEIDSAGRIFIGGDFTSIAGTNRTRVARLTAAFALDTAFDTSTAGPNTSVNTLAPVGDGSVFVGGNFTQFGANTTAAIKYMVRLNASGGLAGTFTSGASNTVHALVRRSDGKLYVGGLSNTWAESLPPPGTPARRLILIDPDGGRVAAYVPPGDFPNYPNIHSLMLLNDGSLFAGGNVGGNPGYVERLNANTGADLGYSLSGHFLEVHSVAQQPDGKLLSGSYGKLFRTALDGTVDATFDLGTGFNAYINAIKVDSAGRIYVGGSFNQLNGVSQNRFAILNGGDLESRNGHLPSQTITFNELAGRAFNPAANSFAVSATASSGLPVTFEVSGPATINGNTVTITGTGDVTVTASQPGNDEFAPASPVSRTFTVTKGNQTINFNALADRPAGSAPFDLSATASSGLTVSFEYVSGPATLNGKTLTLTGEVGKVTVRALQEGNANFNPAAPVERFFQATSAPVVQVAQKITFAPPATVFLAEGPLTLTATANSNLPITLTVLSGPGTLAGDVLTFTGTGAIKVRASQAGNASFKPAPNVDKTITVKADPTVLTLLNLKQTYTGDPCPIDTLGGAGPVTITYKIGATFEATPPTNAGTYQVKATDGTSTKSGSLAIAKAPLQVIPDNQRKFAGQPNPFPLTFSYSGFLGDDNADNSVAKAPNITTTATANSSGGNYPIKAAGGTSANYTFVYLQGVMTVETFAGQYEALLKDADELPVAKLELTVANSSKAFTGKLTTRTETAVVSLKGDLTTNVGTESASGTATVTKGPNTYVLTFSMPLGGAVTAAVTLNGAPFASDTEGVKLLVLAKGQTLSHVGAHTIVLAPAEALNPGGNPFPAGAGYATGTIDAKGVLKLAGKLADGTTLTASLAADADAAYRLMAPAYGARTDSYASGWIDLEEHPDLTGRRYISGESDTQILWIKAGKAADKSYRAGFGPLATQFVMDPWLPPAPKKGVVPAITLPMRLGLNETGDIEVEHSSLTSATAGNLPTDITMDAKGVLKVVAPLTTPVNSTKWKATVTASSGVFTGSFEMVDSGKKRTVPIAGILRQPPASDATDTTIGAGHYLLPSLQAAPNNEAVGGGVFFNLPPVAP